MLALLLNVVILLTVITSHLSKSCSPLCFCFKVLQQEGDINIVSERVVEISENVKDGNEQLREVSAEQLAHDFFVLRSFFDHHFNTWIACYYRYEIILQIYGCSIFASFGRRIFSIECILL